MLGNIDLRTSVTLSGPLVRDDIPNEFINL
jgi:hypothetical protein